MIKINVNYSFTVINSYSGTVEIDKDVYEHLSKEENESEFADMMGDYITLDDPTHSYLDSVYIFK